MHLVIKPHIHELPCFLFYLSSWWVLIITCVNVLAPNLQLIHVHIIILLTNTELYNSLLLGQKGLLIAWPALQGSSFVLYASLLTSRCPWRPVLLNRCFILSINLALTQGFLLEYCPSVCMYDKGWVVVLPVL